MKLDEWKFFKNKPNKNRVQKQSDNGKIASEFQSQNDLRMASSSPASIFETTATSVSNTEEELRSPCSYQEPQTSSIVLRTNPQAKSPPLSNIYPVSAYPLVNSSFCFFSTRPDIESLQMLVDTPSMKEHAIEILLINWKPDSEYLSYAKIFLQDPECCRSLLDFNRIWPYSRTRFDMIDENASWNEWRDLTKAFLKADLRFGLELKGFYPPWATTWREASKARSWERARDLLMTLESRNRLRNCALQVMAEHLLEEHKFENGGWQRMLEENDNGTRNQCRAILKDCRNLGIFLDLHMPAGEIGWP